jgi:hypothetical protein
LIAASYAAGTILQKFLQWKMEGFYFTAFCRLLAGTAIIVILTSLIISKGKTVCNFFLLISILIFAEHYFSGKRISASGVSQTKADLKKILLLLPLLLFPFLWEVFLVFFNAPSYGNVENNGLFYAEVSKCLIYTGQENTFTASNFINDEYRYPTPYHYFDLWLNGITAHFFKQDFSLNLYLVTYPFFMFTLLCGYMGLAERSGKIKFLHIPVVIAMLFVSGLRLSEKISGFENVSSRMIGPTEICFGSHLLPVYCSTLFAFIFYLERKTILFLAFIFCLPVVSISLLPAVSSGLFIFLIIRLFFHKELRAETLRYLAYYIILFTGIALYYKFFQKSNLNYRADKALINYTDLATSSLSFTLAEICYKSWPSLLLLLVNYFPFLPVLFFLFREKKESQGLILFVFLILATGLIIYNAFYKLEDSHQFFINSITLLHVLLCTGMIIFLFYREQNKTLKIIVLVSFFSAAGINCIYSFSSYKKNERMEFSGKFVEEVNKTCNELKGITLGGILEEKYPFADPRDAVNLEFNSIRITYISYPYIASPNVCVPFNLSPPDVLEQTSITLKNPFSKFIENQKKKGIIKTLNRYQEEFIRKNHLRYLICNKRDDPAVLKNIKIKKRIEDERSGEVFVLLDNE